MKSHAPEQQTIRAYLLGQLSSELLSEFEERLLTESDLFEELEIVEDELVDEYLREELTPADRAGFESHFLVAPEHREKLSFARAFKKSLTNKLALPSQASAPVTHSIKPTLDDTSSEEAADARVPGPRKSWFEFFGIRNPALGYATAVALVLVVVGLSWVVWRRATVPRDPGRVLSVVLASGLTRGEGEAANIVRVPAGTDTLRLQLILPDSRYQSFEATLLDAESVELTTKSNLATQTIDDHRAVSLDVPANLVPPGDYRVKLNGAMSDGTTMPVASYSFRVTVP